MEQYTAGGVPVPEAYNGQADDLSRIPGFLNAAFTVIYSKAMPETKITALIPAETIGDAHLCLLPEDCLRMKTGGVFRLCSGRPVRTAEWFPWGTRGILVNGEKGPHYAEYCPYPPRVPESPDADEVVLVSSETAQAAAFYCASLLLLGRDSHACTALMNEFECRLEAMQCRLRAWVEPVKDVLGGAEQ